MREERIGMNEKNIVTLNVRVDTWMRKVWKIKDRDRKNDDRYSKLIRNKMFKNRRFLER